MKLPRSLPIDGMHHLFLNLAPTFIGLFDLDENYCTEVHTILENAITPSFINRGIKSLSDRNYWKAERMFLFELKISGFVEFKKLKL